MFFHRSSLALPALLGVLCAAPAYSAHAAVIPVSPTGSVNAGIAAAHPGDTVLVLGGVHHESVVITTPNISLIGVSGATLDGTGVVTSSDGITVEASGVAIAGLTIQNYTTANSAPGDGAGVSFQSGSNDSISYCILQKNSIGAEQVGATMPHVDANTVTQNQVAGLYLYYSAEASYNTITQNGQGGDQPGISLGDFGSDIENNLITNNVGDGITVGFLNTAETVYNTIAHNTITGNGNDGILLGIGSNQNIVGNIITTNTFCGIEVEDYQLPVTTPGTISGNTISSNEFAGILLGSASGLTISYNTVNKNADYGIYATSTATGNKIIYDMAYGNTAQGGYDAEDDTGTTAATVLNTWRHDLFGVTNPPGLGK